MVGGGPAREPHGPDLGLALLPDEPYTRGKCYKLLQYAAAGTLVIVSPVGVNQQILSQLGMPAPGDRGEWVDAILDLLTKSAGARARLGGRAREVIQLHYSYDSWLSRWQEVVGIADSSERAPGASDTAGDTRQTA